MGLEDQAAVKRVADEHGNGVVVLLGTPDTESTRTLASTVVTGDPSFAGPLAGVPLGLPVFHIFEPDIKQQVPRANIKPRLRMTSLYFLANSLNFLVAGTGNRSELALGYFTKYGDGGVDVLPIGHLLKSEVRSLAKELGVPQPILDKPPSAGLWAGQTDEAEMGFTYEMLEAYLMGGAPAVSPDVARRIEELQRASAHKRGLAPIPNEVN